MTTITIKQYKDPVWFLGGDGFHNGWIKTAMVVSDLYNTLTIKYFVVHAKDNDEYMGRELDPSLVFDSKEEMLKYYSSKL